MPCVIIKIFIFRAFCVGSKDMNTRVYGAQHFRNLVVYSMSGHRDAIVGSFFEDNSLDVSFVYLLSEKTFSFLPVSKACTNKLYIF